MKKIDSSGIMTTVAGNGTCSSSGDGGLATSASLLNPADMVVASDGTVYFVDGGTKIRKINGTTGVISTIYTAPSGQLYSLAFAPDGNLYLGYENAYIIQKLNLANNTATTIAGNGVNGYSGDGGLATNASLVNVRDIAVDDNGNIYFTEGGLRIRKIDIATGIISTVAGSGTVTSLTNGIAASSIKNTVQNGLAMYNNEVHFTTLNQGIWKILSDGTIKKVANNPGFGQGMGQDIEFGSDGTLYSAFASSQFNGYVLRACSNIDTQPLSSQTVCPNGTATTLSVNAGFSSYQWYVNNTSIQAGTAISGQNSNSYLPPTNTAGTLYYYCKVSNSCGTIFSNISSVTVLNAPTATVSSPITKCTSNSPTAISLSSGTAIGGSASTGAWSIVSGGGTLSSTAKLSDPGTVTYTPAANYVGDVILKLTAYSSCDSASALKTIQVQGLPTVPTLTSSANNIAPGTNVTLSIQSGSLNGASQWTWYTGSCGGSNVGTGTSINVTLCGGSNTYYARATGGCASANGSCGSVTVNVNTTNNNFYPQINEMTVNGSVATKTQNANSPSSFSFTNCGTQSTTIALSNANLNQASSWKWYTGGCGTSNGGTLVGTGTSITVTPTSTVTYYVRGEGSNNCLTNMTCNPITITVNPAPVCQNGGTAVNCGCNCPNGYSGANCENIAVAASTLDFDGTNDYVELADVNNLLNFEANQAFSLEAWIKPVAPQNANNGSNNFIVSKLSNIAKGYAMFTSGSELQVAISNDFTQNQLILVQTSGANLLNGSWHHVAETYNGNRNASGLTIYIDGVAATTSVLSNSLTASMSIQNTQTVKIGGSPFGTFRGRMDELRIWDTELSATDITTKMNCEAGNSPNLVASYHFNHGLAGSNNTTPSIINTLTDASGNAIRGTLLNFALTGVTSNWQEFGALTSGVSCCTMPDMPTIYSTGFDLCPNHPFTLHVDNSSNLNSATQWEWFLNDCNGTSLGTGSSITLTLNGSASYYCRGTGGCVSNADCNFIAATTQDNNAPVFNPVTDTTVYANATGCKFQGTITTPTATDNCASNVTISGPVPVGPYSLGTTTVTWTASDGNGNTSTQTQNIIVLPVNTNGRSSVSSCGSYTWTENANTVYTSSGVKTATFTNSIGCDSLHSLNLTIKSVPVVTAYPVSVCPGNSITLSGTPAGGTFSVNNPYSGPSTTFTYTYTNAQGCTATSAPAAITAFDVTPPTNITVTENGTAATVNWTPSSNLFAFNIRYRVVNTNTWTTTLVFANTTTLNNLTTCSNYECQLQAVCPGGTGGPWSSVTTFTTSSKEPGTLSATVSGTNGTLSWTSVPGTASYGIRYRRTNPLGTWVNVTSSTNSKVISGLPRNACYEYQVQSFCTGASAGSAWSVSKAFCTAGAAPVRPGVGATEETEVVSIYPNPANDVFSIDVSYSPSEKTEIKLYDLSGRLIKSFTLFGVEEKHHVELDVRNFVTGMYLVHVYEDNSLTHVSKVLIQP